MAMTIDEFARMLTGMNPMQPAPNRQQPEAPGPFDSRDPYEKPTSMNDLMARTRQYGDSPVTAYYPPNRETSERMGRMALTGLQGLGTAAQYYDKGRNALATEASRNSDVESAMDALRAGWNQERHTDWGDVLGIPPSSPTDPWYTGAAKTIGRGVANTALDPFGWLAALKVPGSIARGTMGGIDTAVNMAKQYSRRSEMLEMLTKMPDSPEATMLRQYLQENAPGKLMGQAWSDLGKGIMGTREASEGASMAGNLQSGMAAAETAPTTAESVTLPSAFKSIVGKDFSQWAPDALGIPKQQFPYVLPADKAPIVAIGRDATATGELGKAFGGTGNPVNGWQHFLTAQRKPVSSLIAAAQEAIPGGTLPHEWTHILERVLDPANQITGYPGQQAWQKSMRTALPEASIPLGEDARMGMWRSGLRYRFPEATHDLANKFQGAYSTPEQQTSELIARASSKSPTSVGMQVPWRDPYTGLLTDEAPGMAMDPVRRQFNRLLDTNMHPTLKQDNPLAGIDPMIQQAVTALVTDHTGKLQRALAALRAFQGAQ